MHPALFQLLIPTTELRRVSSDLRSDRYGDAVRRADVGGRLELPRQAIVRRLGRGLAAPARSAHPVMAR